MAYQQTWDPDRNARNARFVADLGVPVVDLTMRGHLQRRQKWPEFLAMFGLGLC